EKRRETNHHRSILGVRRPSAKYRESERWPTGDDAAQTHSAIPARGHRCLPEGPALSGTARRLGASGALADQRDEGRERWRGLLDPVAAVLLRPIERFICSADDVRRYRAVGWVTGHADRTGDWA